MVKTYIKLSDSFIDKLALISAGFISPESFDSLVKIIEKEFSRYFFNNSSESNFLRIIQAMYDKASILNDSVKYPLYIEILAAISSNTNYLTDILVRNPEYFYIIINPSSLKRKLIEEEFRTSVTKSLSMFKSYKAKVNSLRNLKRKEILRIGTRDILGFADLKEITEELSVLAKVITSELFSLSYEEILNKYNIKNIQSEYCMISLGKLGGNELNYSSDIDLIIFYDQNVSINNKEYYEILTEAVYLFIESATAITDAGYLYRVDFRLRPDGRTSALCRSFHEYLLYYESRGEDWERQMLIKSSHLAGSKELYNKFYSFLIPYIYPSTFITSPIEQIKRLKSDIEKNLKDEKNIKLVSGGIRDIEFSLQALQLLNGGKIQELRTSNSLEALDRLNKHKLLTDEETETLKKSYIFYRKIEHYLQLMNDRQTHSIPESGEILEKLSSFLGFSSSDEFNENASLQRKKVKEIYDSIFNVKEEHDSFNILNEINFISKDKAEKDLLYLREGKGLLGQKQFDKNTINAFKEIESNLFNYLKNSSSPDKVLSNFVRVIRSEPFTAIWYKEFTDKNFFKTFLTVCEYSQKSVDIFSEDEELRELFITRKVFDKITDNDYQNFSLKKIIFKLSVQFTVGLINYKIISETLSTYFRKKIEIISEKYLKEKDYFIAAMGSFGSGEMTFSSDMDLIFVVKSIQGEEDIQKKFQVLFNKFKEDFKPFDVDCRLRPEGASSILVWELNSYINYLEKRARIWEFQAFVKLGFICGNKNMFNKFKSAVIKRIEKEDKNKIKNEIISMRRKLYPQIAAPVFSLKKSHGGLTDLDFIIQYLLLINPAQLNEAMGKGIEKSLKTLADFFEKDDLKKIKNSYSFLKNIEIAFQVIHNTSSSSITLDDKKTYFTGKFLNYKSNEEFIRDFKETTKNNSSLFRKYLPE